MNFPRLLLLRPGFFESSFISMRILHTLCINEFHVLLLLLPDTTSVIIFIPINITTCPMMKQIMFRKVVVLERISGSSSLSADLYSWLLIRLRFEIVFENNIPKTTKCTVIQKRIQYFGLGQ